MLIPAISLKEFVVHLNGSKLCLYRSVNIQTSEKTEYTTAHVIQIENLHWKSKQDSLYQGEVFMVGLPSCFENCRYKKVTTSINIETIYTFFYLK